MRLSFFLGLIFKYLLIFHDNTINLSAAEQNSNFIRKTNKKMETRITDQDELADVMLLQKENAALLGKLQEIEKRWKFTIESNGDGLWEWDAITNGVLISKEWKMMLGYSNEEISDRQEKWENRIHPDDIIEVYNDLNRHLEGKTEIYSNIHRVKCKDGSYKWVLDRGKIFERDEKGDPLRIIGTHTDISHLKETEERLKQSEINFNSFYNTIEDFLFVLDTEGRIIRLNHTVINRLEYLSEELIGTSILKLYPSEIREEADKILQDMLSGKEKSCSIPLVKKDGTQIPVDSKCVLGKWNGEDALFVVTYDISELRKSEIELCAQKEWLNIIFQTTRAGIMILDRDEHVIVDVNKTALEMMKSKKENVIGKICHQFVCPAEHSHCPVTDYNKKIVDEERVLFTSNGDNIPIIKSVIEQKIGDKYYLIESFTDITLRKKTEHKLFLSEKKYREIFENVQDVFYQTDNKGNIIEISPSIERYSGYSRAELLGQPAENVYLNPSERTEMIKLIYSKGQVDDYELSLRCKDKRTVIVSLNAHILYDGSDTPIGIEGSLRDISDRKKAEEELKKINEELKINKELLEDHEIKLNQMIYNLEESEQLLIEANTSKDKFFSIISHDLRAPFTGFLNLSNIMSKEIETLSIMELKEIAKTLHGTSVATYKLLNDLLEWSRIQTNTIIYNPDNFDVEEIILEATNMMKQLVEDKKIFFIKEIEPGIQSYCDRNMALNVVRNLFSNAVKFTNEGGSIKITSKQTDDDIEISVEDTGVGIPTKSLDKLFKIDTTKDLSTKGTAGEKGSGLGLILCKEFVERNGGEIVVKSEVGKGSIFSFSIKKALVTV